MMSLENAARIASDDIARAVETVARTFVGAGGYGSLKMHLASNERIIQVFRSAVGQMTAEAQGFDKDSVRDLLDSHLSGLIARTLAERRAHLVTANAAADDTTALCASLHHDMKRLKDIAVRRVAMT